MPEEKAENFNFFEDVCGVPSFKLGKQIFSLNLLFIFLGHAHFQIYQL